MSAVAGSFVQDVDARAVGAHHLPVLDTQEHAGWPRALTAVTGDGAVVDVKGLRWKGAAERSGPSGILILGLVGCVPR